MCCVEHRNGSVTWKVEHMLHHTKETRACNNERCLFGKEKQLLTSNEHENETKHNILCSLKKGLYYAQNYNFSTTRIRKFKAFRHQ